LTVGRAGHLPAILFFFYVSLGGLSPLRHPYRHPDFRCVSPGVSTVLPSFPGRSYVFPIRLLTRRAPPRCGPLVPLLLRASPGFSLETAPPLTLFSDASLTVDNILLCLHLIRFAQPPWPPPPVRTSVGARRVLWALISLTLLRRTVFFLRCVTRN